MCVNCVYCVCVCLCRWEVVKSCTRGTWPWLPFGEQGMKCRCWNLQSFCKCSTLFWKGHSCPETLIILLLRKMQFDIHDLRLPFLYSFVPWALDCGWNGTNRHLIHVGLRRWPKFRFYFHDLSYTCACVWESLLWTFWFGHQQRWPWNEVISS